MRFRSAGLSGAGPWFLGATALALAAVLSAVALFRIRLNMDVGWMLYLAERVGAGERLYVDRIEVNLPWIVHLSRAPVMLAGWVGVSSITAFRFILLTGVVAATSFATVRLPLRTSRHPAGTLIVAAVLLLVLLWMAGSDIGQREHLLVLALVPYLMLRWPEKEPRAATALVVGAAMGVAVALKPHFLPIWLALEIGRHFEGYSWRRPETLTAAVVLVISWALLPVLHPEYLDQLRKYGGLYADFRRFSLGAMIRVETVTFMVGFVALLASRRDSRLSMPIRELLLLVGATLLVAIVQGKGFTYHLYPAHALAALLLLLLATAWVPAGAAPWISRLTLLLVAVSLALYSAWAGSLHRWSETRGQDQYRPAVDLVRRAGLEEGSLLVLSPHMLDAFPLVNLTGLDWASRYNSLWPLLSLYVAGKPMEGTVPFRSLPEMGPAERVFFQSVRADLIRYHPELLLVATDQDPFLGGRFDYWGYLSQDSSVARILDQYERVSRGERLDLYARRGGSASVESP